jgi:hypothetical protein
MSLNFDPEDLSGIFTIEGKMADIVVKDPDGDPNHVLEPGLPFTIDVTWSLSGSLVGALLAVGAANWVVNAYAESVGPGPEVEIASTLVPKASGTTVAGVTTFTATLTVPGGTLPEDAPGVSGLYKLIGSVFLNSTVPGPYDLSGFSEGPIIRMETHA